MIKLSFHGGYGKAVIFRSFILEVTPCYINDGVSDYLISVEQINGNGQPMGFTSFRDFGSELSQDEDGVVINMPSDRFKITAELDRDYITICIERLDEVDLRIVLE